MVVSFKGIITHYPFKRIYNLSEYLFANEKHLFEWNL